MSLFKRIGQYVVGTSATEFSGYKWMVFTGLACTATLFLMDKLTYTPYQNQASDARQLDSLLALMEKPVALKSPLRVEVKLHSFNPNTATVKTLEGLGVPGQLANRIAHYRQAGGYFNRPMDLLKIYGFPDSLYQQLAPWVYLPQKKQNPAMLPEQSNGAGQTARVVEKEPTPAKFDLNQADTTRLMQFKGIGSKLSARIINYRNALGGFVQPNQLYEVYYLDSGLVDNILRYGFVDSNFKPAPIPLNTATQKQLAAHPYISYHQARLIIAYRTQHGNYKNTRDLAQVYALNEQWIKKIAPYLSF